MEVTVWVDGGRTATEVGREEAGEDQEIGRFARLGKLGRLGRGRGKGFGRWIEEGFLFLAKLGQNPAPTHGKVDNNPLEESNIEPQPMIIKPQPLDGSEQAPTP
jgi:hypothetical protein